MRANSYARNLHLLTLFVLSVSILLGQVTPAQPDAERVQLDLRIGDGRVQFHLGEIIPVRLVFSSNVPKKYFIWGRECFIHQTYQYHIDPPAFIDRALTDDATMSMSDMTCGGGGNDVENRPGEPLLTVTQTLNDRFQMDVPGRYRISVTSSRIGVPVTSNTVDLEILPSDGTWEQAELARAIKRMEASSEKPEHYEGCRILSFLESRAAEIEMIRSYSGLDNCDQQFQRKIIAARDRKGVLDLLEAQLKEPGRVISGGYLRLIAMVSLYQEHPDWYPTPAPEDPGSANKTWVAPTRSGLWQQQKGVLAGRELLYAQMLAAALPRKTPAARAQGLRTLLGMGTFIGPEDVPVELFETARALLPGVFLALPEQDQRSLLLYQWPDLKSAAMIPVLRTITAVPLQAAYAGIHQAALLRLFDLSPELARPLLLSEIGSPNPFVGMEVLRLMPDRELPAFDDVMLERVNQQLPYGNGNLVIATALVERYASPAIAGKLRPLLDSHLGNMECGSEANLLAYFLRVTPRDGAELLGKALPQKQCSGELLSRLADVRMSPEVETAAIAALEEKDARVVEEALRVLQRHGSVRTKQTILDHFRLWHEDQGRIGTSALVDSAAQGFEGAYFEAASAAQAWLTSPEEVRALGAFCTTLQCKQNAEQAAIYSAQVQFIIGFVGPDGDETTEHFWLGRCPVGNMDRLKEKMSQYPQGTQFQLDARFRQQRAVQRIWGELKPWAVDHGFDVALLGQ